MVLSLSPIPWRKAASLASVGLLAPVVACGGEPSAEAPPARSGIVLATTSIWADVIGEITCNGEAGVTVEPLMPPGIDPHQYEPSLQDRQRLERARLVVANGAGLEAGAAPLLDSVNDDRLVTVTELPGLQLLAEDAEGDGVDPHLWLDPTIVAATIGPLADAVVEAGDGADADAVAACAEEYRQELEALDAEITGAVDALPEQRRVLVTNHDAYGYFAKRYGFEVVGTVIPSTSTQAETNAADLEGLAATIERHDVPAIFVDIDHDGAEAENLARTVGIGVVRLATDSLSSEGDDARGSYVELMRTITTAVVGALNG